MMSQTVRTPYGLGSVIGYNEIDRIIQVLLHVNGSMKLSIHEDNVQRVEEASRNCVKRHMSDDSMHDVSVSRKRIAKR